MIAKDGNFTAEKGTLHVAGMGAGDLQLVWAHGWGVDHATFAPLAQSFAHIGASYLPDFPGFGKSPAPDGVWGARDYADLAALWLKTLPAGKRIWIGHSFGCRVGLQIAAHYPDLIDRLVLIGPAGLKRQRSLFRRLQNWFLVRTFKTLKLFVPEGPRRDALRARFGSPDYRNAGSMRPGFLKVVNEDLSADFKTIVCPTLIICGDKDSETPPETAQRLHGIISGSTLHILPGFDHYSILSAGRHQVAGLIKGFTG